MSIRLKTGLGWSKLAKLTWQILEGEVDVVYQQAVVPRSRCDEIAARFDASPEKRLRGDGVPGAVLGESHYGSDPATYMQASRRSAAAVSALFAGLENPILRLYRELEIESGRHVRPAMFNGDYGLPCRAGAWAAHPHALGWAVRPHDDVAQVRADINNEWEIRDVPRLVALNFYPRVLRGTGQLVVWDLCPDDAIREAFGVRQTGYPYPDDLASSRPFVELPVQAGDFAIIFGGQIHGVRASSHDRLVINAFIGLLPNGDLGYWT